MKTILLSAGAFALAAIWLPLGNFTSCLFFSIATLLTAGALLAPVKRRVIEHCCDALKGLK